MKYFIAGIIIILVWAFVITKIQEKINEWLKKP